MRVLLDDIPCDVTATTVSQAIEAAAVVANNKGRLIVEVSVDGSQWTEQQLTSPEAQVAIADVVCLTSAEPAEMVGDTFADAAEALADADELQQDAAELLQAGQHRVSMDKLQEAISIWLSVQEAIVKSAQLIGLNLDDVVVNDTPLTASISRLNERLQTIRSALRENDLIGLADTLLYEFPEVVQEWREILDDLQQRVGRRGQES